VLQAITQTLAEEYYLIYHVDLFVHVMCHGTLQNPKLSITACHGTQYAHTDPQGTLGMGMLALSDTLHKQIMY
jgi:hypothetical protein